MILKTLSLDQIVEGLVDENQRWDALLHLKCYQGDFASLVTFLRHESFFVRWAIADKCGALKLVLAVDSLIFCLMDSEILVQKSAQKALLRIGGVVYPRLCFFLSNLRLRPAILSFMLSFNKKQLYLLKPEVISSTDFVVVQSLIFVFWQLDRVRCETVFIQFLTNPKARKTLIFLLGELKSLVSIRYFILLYKYFDLRYFIRQSLLKIGENRAYPVVVSSLSDIKYSVFAKEIILKIGISFLPYLLSALTEKKQDCILVLDIIERLDPLKCSEAIEHIEHSDPLLFQKIQNRIQKLNQKKPFWRQFG